MRKNILKSISILLMFTGGFCFSQNIEQDSVTENKKIQNAVDAYLKERDVNLKFYGFIRHDAMLDSRQTVDVREAAVVMWSKDRKYDANGEDINSASQFQMLSILSRMGVKIKGPDVLGAKLNGVLEGDYFGNAEGGINEFRLRHAWITLNWAKTQIGAGQFWHPLTIPEIFPGTVNFSGGAPYMPYNRNPQIRLTQKLGNHFNMIVAAISQRDFTANTEPYTNSGVPAGHLQFNYKTNNFTIGLAGHYENIRPKTNSGTLGLYSNERLNSVTGMLYSRWDTKHFTLKSEATLAQNAASFIMLGGFVGYTKPDGSLESYQTMNTQAYWIDFTAKTDKKIVPGFFAGYSKNNGVDKYNSDPTVTAQAYGFSAVVSGIGAGAGARTINYIYRVAPRLEYVLNKLKFGLEFEYSMAEWGDADNRGRAVANLSDVANSRIIFATTFNF